MPNAAPSQALSRWHIPRIEALVGLTLALGGLLVTSTQTWTLTVTAPLGWRLRALLPDALISVPCAVGFAFAAGSPVRWRQRAGWGLAASKRSWPLVSHETHLIECQSAPSGLE